MTADDFVVVDVAAENEHLRRLTCSYREALQVALAQLAERNAELERARRQNAALRAEVRALRDDTVAA